MRKNVTNDKDLEDFKSKFFKAEGYKVLLNYTKSLILEYIKQNKSYPYTLNPVLGIPLFEYVMTIHSEEELLGRIKILGQILGIKNVSFKLEKEFVEFEFTGKYSIMQI